MKTITVRLSAAPACLLSDQIDLSVTSFFLKSERPPSIRPHCMLLRCLSLMPYAAGSTKNTLRRLDASNLRYVLCCSSFDERTCSSCSRSQSMSCLRSLKASTLTSVCIPSTHLSHQRALYHAVRPAAFLHPTRWPFSYPYISSGSTHCH